VGLRTGRYSRNESALMIQIALPEDVAQDPSKFVREATSAAIDEAARWAERRKVQIDTSILHGILDQL
jgi:predicted O-linked N-acetylglucosamine transferase (SPINDLY family)